MPRRTGLLPLELAILRIAAAEPLIHGFGVAQRLRDVHGAGLTAHGTLYKALSRLAGQGLLGSQWEPAEQAVEAGRPRRRLYRITSDGRAALSRADAAAPTPTAATAQRRIPRTAQP